MMNSPDFTKLKDYDQQALLAENMNLKVFLSSLQSEKALELQVLKAQNKEYAEILNNIQGKTSKHIQELQQSWENKCFFLETKNKKLEVELERTSRLLSDCQTSYKEAEIVRLREAEKSRVWNEDLRKVEQEVTKWKEKYTISEERVRDLQIKNDFLYSELQKYKHQCEVVEFKRGSNLDEFQRKINLLQTEYNKSIESVAGLQREIQSKQKTIDSLQSELLRIKDQLDNNLEKSHSEVNQILKESEEKIRALINKNDSLNGENEFLKNSIKKYQAELENIQFYYGSLLGNLQDNIRQNLKETLSGQSPFSTPSRKEQRRLSNDRDPCNKESSLLRERDISQQAPIKFIHKYQ